MNIMYHIYPLYRSSFYTERNITLRKFTFIEELKDAIYKRIIRGICRYTETVYNIAVWRN